MRIEKLVFAAALSVVTISGCNKSGDNSTSPATKEQIKGAWQLSTVGDRSGHLATAVPATSDKVQLLITDTDFRIIISDSQGLLSDIPMKYTFDGKRISTDKTGGVNGFDVVSVTQNFMSLLHVQNPPDPQENAPMAGYKRISEKELARDTTSHSEQTLSVSYTFLHKSGKILGSAEFRSMKDGKSLSCALSSSNAHPGKFLAVQYFEFTEENGGITTSTEKNNNISFSIPKVEFDFSKPTETIHSDARGSGNDSIMGIIDVASKVQLFGNENSECSYDISRHARSLKISGTCTGVSGSGGIDKSSTVMMDAVCELDRGN